MTVLRSRFPVSVACLAALAAGYFGGRPLLERYEFARADADVQATRQQLSTVEDLSTVFREVGKVVEPSVVLIEVRKMIKPDHSGIPDDELRRFFREHGGGDLPGDNNDNNDQPQEEDGKGSGVIMDVSGEYGYILTNNHVAGGADNLKVTLADGRVIPNTDIKLLGADPKSDLALLQVKADRLIPAKWGNSDELQKGDWVLAFGSPFGYVGSMTHGIVSATDRNGVMGNTEDYENFIQVDAPINPGNSGGPLVNLHGEVIGINTAIATLNGGFQGIGFAIPANQAQRVYTALKEHGQVMRGWLGIKISTLSDAGPGMAKSFHFTGTDGVLVDEVFPGTPAYGILQNGDIIIGVNDQKATDVNGLRNYIAMQPPGAKVTMKVFRAGAETTEVVTLGTQPEDLAAVLGHSTPADTQPAAPTNVALGLTLSDLDPDTAQKLGVGDLKGGAVVTNVDHNSAAARAGITPGVVITMIGDTKVQNAQDAINALKGVNLKDGVRLYISNRDGSVFVFLQDDSGN